MRPGAVHADRQAPWVQSDLPGFQPGGPRPPAVPTCLAEAHLAQIPDALRGDWEEGEVYPRLITLCNWLDRELDAPIQMIEEYGEVRVVQVLHTMAFSLQTVARQIACLTWTDKQWQPNREAFDLEDLIADDAFLQPIMALLGVRVPPEQQRFFPEWFVEEMEAWIRRTAFRLLRMDPRFHRLCHDTLPQIFGFPSDLLALARACRVRPKGRSLDSHLFNLVWSHEASFRRVAQECPGLLPLLAIYVLDTGCWPQGKDPVATLKSAVRHACHSEATWRYLARHGAHLFKTVWTVIERQPAWELAMIYLGMLEYAGLPPAPPPSIARLYLLTVARMTSAGLRLDEGFAQPAHPAVLRAGLIEADRRKRQPGLESFFDEFLGVTQWSEQPEVRLDKNQVKAGWNGFVKRWRESDVLQVAKAGVVSRTFPVRLAEFEWGRWKIMPLNSSGALVEEAFAMRNCLQKYVEDCESGKTEVYSIRDKATGKRVACVAFQHDPSLGRMVQHQARGYANTPLRGEVEQVVHHLAEMIW